MRGGIRERGRLRSRHVFLRSHARDERESDGAERDSEEPEWELHEAKRDTEAVGGAVFQPAREPAVDHHIHLHGTCRDDGRAICRTTCITPSSRLVPVKAKSVADAAQRGDLHAELECAADERSNARPMSERGPKVGSIQYASATPPMIEPMLKKDDAIAGMPKTFREFRMPITLSAERDEDDEWEHDLREQHGEIELRGVLLEAGDGDRKQHPARAARRARR
jgi:hypothetical protein